MKTKSVNQIEKSPLATRHSEKIFKEGSLSVTQKFGEFERGTTTTKYDVATPLNSFKRHQKLHMMFNHPTTLLFKNAYQEQTGSNESDGKAHKVSTQEGTQKSNIKALKMPLETQGPTTTHFYKRPQQQTASNKSDVKGHKVISTREDYMHPTDGAQDSNIKALKIPFEALGTATAPFYKRSNEEQATQSQIIFDEEHDLNSLATLNTENFLQMNLRSAISHTANKHTMTASSETLSKHHHIPFAHTNQTNKINTAHPVFTNYAPKHICIL